jgi:hypothetical protein
MEKDGTVISHALTQTCTIIETSLNRFGDYVEQDGAQYRCRFRDITDISELPNNETTGSQAILWLDANAPVQRGTIVKIENEYFRIDRITKARKLTSSNVEFIKCLVEYHGGIAKEEAQS